MRTERAWLEDILDAIQRIQRYTSLGRDAFQEDELIQVWFAFHLVLIGEAARNLARLGIDQPEVPWQDVVAMRNFLVHEYFDTDDEILWATVESELPRLEKQVRQLLDIP